MTLISLAGKRIAITRPRGQSAELSQELGNHGALPLVIPLIEITDPSDEGFAFEQAMKNISQYEWVVCTSANGSHRVAPYIGKDASRPKLAAVGSATGSGFLQDVDFVPSQATGQTLANEFPLTKGKVLLVQAQETSGDVAQTLRQRGCVVDEVTAYQTVIRNLETEEFEQLLSADAVVFASGSAVRSFVRQCGTRYHGAIVVIGEPTRLVAKELGVSVSAVATAPTTQSITHALGGVFR
jgi:uroporphyrinogen-III synthase